MRLALPLLLAILAASNANNNHDTDNIVHDQQSWSSLAYREVRDSVFSAAEFLARTYSERNKCWKYQFFFDIDRFGPQRLKWENSCSETANMEMGACANRELHTLEVRLA